MTITVFPDVVLSERVVAAGVKGRQMRRNDRVRTANGVESINIVWDRTVREFDLGIKPMKRERWLEIETIFEITDGGAYGFLMLDPKDHTADDGGRVAEVDGGYQLYKRYAHPLSGRYKDRKITRPMSGAVTVLVSGVVTSATIDTTDGTLTITGDPDPVNVRWTGSFYVPVHFLNDQIDWDVLRPGSDPDTRLLAGPMVTLQEICE